MRVLSYNIRGIRSSAKGRIIRNLLSNEKIDFACFQETKIGLIDATFCQRLWGNEECEYLYSPAINRGGGLLCIWRKGNFVVEESNCNPRWIYLKGKWGGSGETYAFINVYAPCSSEEKRQLWGELVNCRRRSTADCWCVLGDFNSVRDPNERKGIAIDTSVSRRDTEFFNDFIHSMELVDVPMTGRRFTWFRPNGSAMSRLDRCLISLDWLALWPHSVQHILDRDISDHCPVVLKHLNQEWGPKPFRVLNCWHSDIRFRKFVEESWGGLASEGDGIIMLKEKLKKFKCLLKGWNSEVFGDLNSQKKEAVRRMNELDIIAANQALSVEEINERKDLMGEFWRVTNLQESLLRQKSRVQWLKDGDANSGFFHRMVNWRRRSNAINGLVLDDVWQEDPTAVKEGIKDFFEQKFKESSGSVPTLDGIPFAQLSQVDNALLTSEFDLAEIKAAVWDCDGNKSPGPDGYNFKFIKEFWDLLQFDVKRLVDDFSANGRWPRGTNSSFITLIPKVDSPQNLNEFRPISLVGCLYKIITKLLAARLKLVLHKVIAENQSAFLGGRNMLDSVVIANEVLHEAKGCKIPSLILKVDFEKAYDSVRWSFLVYMMRRMNFSEVWIRWVVGCLESSYVSVLVNGSPTNEFRMEKGIRQGDPLAPFLFLIVAEGLTGILREAISSDNFQPISVGREVKVDVALLQFADDAIFFGRACLQTAKTLKCILRCFELVSGMKVNFHKSKLAGVAIDVSVTERFAALLNCRRMNIPFVYLGLPVGANPRRLSTWEPMLDKLRRRLASWKGKQLSFGGRLCLVKSVLTALPLYYISFFKMPKGILHKCKQLMMRFLWGGDEEERKISWVSWTQVCSPKVVGGLGVRDLELFNVALLGKWRWRFLHNRNQLWCQVLQSKYGNGELSKASVWWKDLNNSCVGEAAGHWFEKGICRRIGEGDDTRFWQEDWLGGGLFSELFPNLFIISDQQMCRVAEMGMWTENNWHWDLKWSEEILGNLLSQRNELLRLITTVPLVRGKSDSWRWKYESNGIYSVSSAYEKLMDFDLSDMDTNFTTLWSTLAPSNALAMCWRVFIDRIQSKVNLIARNIPLASSLCSLCLIQDENTNHLFIFCPFACRVWALTLRWLGWLFVPPALARDHFQQFIGVGSGSMKKGLAVIWVAVIWQIWISRNGFIFRQEHSTPEQVFDQARNKAWLWLKAKHRRFHHTISDWLGEPIACCAVL